MQNTWYLTNNVCPNADWPTLRFSYVPIENQLNAHACEAEETVSSAGVINQRVYRQTALSRPEGRVIYSAYQTLLDKAV